MGRGGGGPPLLRRALPHALGTLDALRQPTLQRGADRFLFVQGSVGTTPGSGACGGQTSRFFTGFCRGPRLRALSPHRHLVVDATLQCCWLARANHPYRAFNAIVHCEPQPNCEESAERNKNGCARHSPAPAHELVLSSL